MLDDKTKTNGTETEGAENGADDNGAEPKAKTYTQEEVDALLQSETDRRVTAALKKQEAKNQSKVREAEKLARMSADEKFAYELEQREAAIIAKERELALAENKNEASKILADKGISLELVDFVVAESADAMNANINLLDKAFKKSVKAEVEKRLGSDVPKKNLADPEAITKEKFQKMSLGERQQLLKEDPDLYMALTGRK